jgi:MFS transporter, FHS family, L-fucose permease
LYWGGALVGRFIGSAVLRKVSPGKVLAGHAVGAVALILISANTTAPSRLQPARHRADELDHVPDHLQLACEGLGPRAADGSGII